MSRSRDTGRVSRITAVMLLVWLLLNCGYRITSFLGDPEVPSGPTLALGLAVIVVVYALPIPIALWTVPWRAAAGILAAQAVLAFAPYAIVGAAWRPVSSLLLGTWLLTSRSRWRWPAAALIVTGEVVVRVVAFPERDPTEPAWAALATLATGLSLFAIARLAGLATELDATRAELAPLEVARERLRIERDLRAVLVARLAMIDREACAGLDAERLAGSVTAARQALAEVRAISDDYRDRSLTAEVESVRAVLAAAGVPSSIDAPPGGLPPRVDAALAGVLRRTVVGALRLGTPDRCRVELDGTARLRVSFTGLDAAPLPETPADAAREIAELGGRVTVGPDVTVDVPVRRRRLLPIRNPGPVGAAPWLAWAVLLVLEIDHFGSAVLNVLGAHEITWTRYSPAGVAVAAVTLPLIGVLQLHHVRPRADGAPPPAWRWTLTLQLLLLLTAFAVVGDAVPTPYAGLVAGVVLFHGRRSAWSYGIVTLLLLAAPPLRDLNAPISSYLQQIFITLLMMLTVYALCRLPVAVRELAGARRELARLAVLRERLRIARDVHDLLGSQLSAIVVKGELAARLADRDPETARRHLADMGEAAERALATARSITREPAELVLTEEAEAVRSMLSAAGVETRIALGSTEAGPLLAVVLREAVTNVVRHANAQVCEIDVSRDDGAVRLRVRNDGVLPEVSARRGTGLANLRSRIEEAGGRLTVRREDDRFILTAEVPVPPLADQAPGAMAAA